MNHFEQQQFWRWHTLLHLGVQLDESASLSLLCYTLDQAITNLSSPRTLVYDCSKLSLERLQGLLLFWGSARLRYRDKLHCQMSLPKNWRDALHFTDGSKLLWHVRDDVLKIPRT